MYGMFDCSRHETEPTVVILIDRRHGNWSSVKAILHAINVRHILVLSASVSLVVLLFTVFILARSFSSVECTDEPDFQ